MAREAPRPDIQAGRAMARLMRARAVPGRARPSDGSFARALSVGSFAADGLDLGGGSRLYPLSLSERLRRALPEIFGEPDSRGDGVESYDFSHMGLLIRARIDLAGARGPLWALQNEWLCMPEAGAPWPPRRFEPALASFFQSFARACVMGLPEAPEDFARMGWARAIARSREIAASAASPAGDAPARAARI